mgnify:CR=1 FL=1
MIIALRNFVCIIGLIIILPVLCCITILIIIEDGFPPFFTQERLGMDKKIFKIYKIRTMKKNTPQLGTHEVKSHFQLRSGVLARSLKLDEFPQLLNVIKGDINLVGPRPGLINQTELDKVRTKNGIFKIKPGITGLSQILGFDMSDPARLSEIDKIYLLNCSSMLDIMILAGTFFKFPRKYICSKLNIQPNN